MPEYGENNWGRDVYKRQILGVSSYYQDVIKGLVILIAVLSDRKR